jgi:hypothetical protein
MSLDETERAVLSHLERFQRLLNDLDRLDSDPVEGQHVRERMRRELDAIEKAVRKPATPPAGR